MVAQLAGYAASVALLSSIEAAAAAGSSSDDPAASASAAAAMGVAVWASIQALHVALRYGTVLHRSLMCCDCWVVLCSCYLSIGWMDFPSTLLQW